MNYTGDSKSKHTIPVTPNNKNSNMGNMDISNTDISAAERSNNRSQVPGAYRIPRKSKKDQTG